MMMPVRIETTYLYGGVLVVTSFRRDFFGLKRGLPCNPVVMGSRESTKVEEAKISGTGKDTERGIHHSHGLAACRSWG
jgi:hypothetical protein